ncbi:MAG: hypothetical protein AAGI71_04765 [Bacteroidota bacterium]
MADTSSSSLPVAFRISAALLAASQIILMALRNSTALSPSVLEVAQGVLIFAFFALMISGVVYLRRQPD